MFIIDSWKLIFRFQIKDDIKAERKRLRRRIC